MLRLSLMILICTVGAATARDNGQYQNVPEDIRNWFNEQTSPKNGYVCCSIADGHETEEDIRNGNWVTIGAKWYPVPASSVIHKPNPVGHPIVWYTQYETHEPVIKCFISGAGL